MAADGFPNTRTVWRRLRDSKGLEKLVEPPPKHLPPTAVLIHVQAISLNYRDINIINGTNPWPVLEDGIPCSDAAGEIIAVGNYVTRFKVGDRVSPIFDQVAITGDEQTRNWLGGEIEGVLASHIVMDQETCVLLPDHLLWEEAACLPNAGITAWSPLVDGSSRKLRAGQTVLLQGTGGVSMMALKFAVAAGSRVFLTSSSDEKLKQVRSLPGCQDVQTINYKTTPAWDEEAIRLNSGRGMDIVVDVGGTSSLMQSLRAVAKGGTISQVGYFGQQDVTHLVGFTHALIDKTAVLRGINVGSRRDAEQMNKFIAASKLGFRDIVSAVFSSDKVDEALEAMRSQKYVGKIVIVMEGT